MMLGVKKWDKFKRSKLTVEDRLAFDKQATGYVLGKHNKLQVFSRLVQDTEILKNVLNLQQQLRTLRNHISEYDIDDAFNIVMPKDSSRSSQIDKVQYNLFDHYPKLDPTMIGNSCAYYRMWVEEEFVQDHLNLTFQLVKNNTEEKLFNKCLEDYEKFHEIQRGGPLMMSLIVRKVQNSSDQWVDCLTRKFETIKITQYKGEDVDQVVSILRGCHNTFESVSTPCDNRFPKDWNKKLPQTFQTSSVEEFNETFHDLYTKAQRDADMNGGTPQWPSTDQILKLATITYDRIKGNDQWDVSKCARKRAHPGVVRKLTVAYSPEEEPVTPPLAAQANVANKTNKPPSPDCAGWLDREA